MKITKARLQQIIKEEIAAATEQDPEAMVDDLMKSQLFSNAAEEDKAEARKIILDALMGLEAYGGTKRPDEEYMDDAFRPYEDLTRRLAQAWRASVPPPPLHYWLDALVAWSLGRKDYEKELYHNDQDLQRMMRRRRSVTNEANLDSLKGSEARDARSALGRIGLDPKDVSHEDYVAASAYAGQQLAKYVRDNGMRFSDLGVEKAQSMADDFVREFLGRKG